MSAPKGNKNKLGHTKPGEALRYNMTFSKPFSDSIREAYKHSNYPGTLNKWVAWAAKNGVIREVEIELEL